MSNNYRILLPICPSGVARLIQRPNRVLTSTTGNGRDTSLGILKQPAPKLYEFYLSLLHLSVALSVEFKTVIRFRNIMGMPSDARDCESETKAAAIASVATAIPMLIAARAVPPSVPMYTGSLICITWKNQGYQ
eukprot:Gb_19698 [translate_table: standard]